MTVIQIIVSSVVALLNNLEKRLENQEINERIDTLQTNTETAWNTKIEETCCYLNSSESLQFVVGCFIYSVSTLFGSFYAEFNFKQFSLI